MFLCIYNNISRDAGNQSGDKAIVVAGYLNLDVEWYKADQAVVLHKAN